ncbi:MAG: hypothetical protein BWY57_03303 [Betaproteobacteria bacterium ADurb.Bin341]|nr:MAG: hypothetical protein BWY57_03303 [Betaproteobacteria bacterium ADurb.Bin341]
MDGGGVAADVAGELAAAMRHDGGLVDALRQPVAGEGVEGAREGRLRGNLPERLPAAQAAQRRAVADGVDQVAGGGEVPDGLGDERLAQRQAVARRAAVAAPTVRGHVVLRDAQLADGHELPVLVVERSDFVLQQGEEP